MTSPAPPNHSAFLPGADGRVSGPINDCGGVDSDTQAVNPEVFAASVSGCEISRGQYRKGIRPEFSRCNSGPQSPIPKPVKSLPTVPPAVLAKAVASINGVVVQWQDTETGSPSGQYQSIAGTGFDSPRRLSIPPELTALFLALCGPVLCVSVMWVISRI